MSVASGFHQIPGNIRVPFIRFEINAAAAPYQSISRLLLMGQKTAGGTAVANQPLWITGGEDALFGVGSQLAGMYKIARANGPFQEIWGIPLSDAAGSTAAVGSISLANFPLVSGDTLVYYLGGLRVAVGVTPLDTANTAATALAAAINACPGIQVSAAVDGTTASKVNVTALNKGTLGNGYRIETRLSIDDGTTTDAVSTIVQPTGGATDPTIDTALANLGGDLWDFIVMPYCQSAPLTTIETWLANRWGPISQTYGINITAYLGTAGAVQSFFATRNSMYTTAMTMNNSPQPAHMLAAAYGAQCAVHLQEAPELSLPLQTIELVGIRPPKNIGDRWDDTTRQALYYDGASAYRVETGIVQIDRAITTYQKNAWGQPDAAWLDINTLAQIVYGVRYMLAYLTSTYPRCALVDENPNRLQNFVTVTDIENAFIHAYKSLVALGVFENADEFAQLLVVERNKSDPSRVDAYLPLDAVNQLRILAANATSFLQYPQAA